MQSGATARREADATDGLEKRVAYGGDGGDDGCAVRITKTTSDGTQHGSDDNNSVFSSTARHRLPSAAQSRKIAARVRWTCACERLSFATPGGARRGAQRAHSQPPTEQQSRSKKHCKEKLLL